MQYNDKGDEIVSTWYFGDGTVDIQFTFEYEYDSKGNWVSKKQFNNGTLVLIFKRFFEYY